MEINLGLNTAQWKQKVCLFHQSMEAASPLEVRESLDRAVWELGTFNFQEQTGS